VRQIVGTVIGVVGDDEGAGPEAALNQTQDRGIERLGAVEQRLGSASGRCTSISPTKRRSSFGSKAMNGAKRQSCCAASRTPRSHRLNGCAPRSTPLSARNVTRPKCALHSTMQPLSIVMRPRRGIGNPYGVFMRGGAARGFRDNACFGRRLGHNDAQPGRKALFGNASTPCRDRSLRRRYGRYVLLLPQRPPTSLRHAGGAVQN
jgi:hypothetical protein